MPVHYKDDLKEKIDAFMSKELITPCHSPYSAPAMLVPKRNGKLRLVIDYRKLNEQTIKSCWPIPSIEEIFDTLQGSAYFTTIYMSWGFYQLAMEPKTQNYTAFSTPFGSFKWLRMPMGLTGSPNTFQSLMEHVLVGLTWNITVPSLDDCISFSKTPEEHIKRLQKVFQRFCEANLKINPTKCAFFQTKVQFLGRVIRNGLEADPEKVKAVQIFSVPQNQTDVKSFLGLCSYYRRYIKNLAMIARPLHKASETKSSFTWTEETQEAFESLKKHLSSTPNSLRQSLGAMTNHANKHEVTQISMPKAGCELDWLEWHKVERLIKEICAQSNLTITVFEQSTDEKSQKQKEAPVRSALGQAQRQDEALYKLT